MLEDVPSKKYIMEHNLKMTVKIVINGEILQENRKIRFTLQASRSMSLVTKQFLSIDDLSEAIKCVACAHTIFNFSNLKAEHNLKNNKVLLARTTVQVFLPSGLINIHIKRFCKSYTEAKNITCSR